MTNRFQLLADMNSGDELTWFCNRGKFRDAPVKCVWRRLYNGFTFVAYRIKVDSDTGRYLDSEHKVMKVFSAYVDLPAWEALRFWQNKHLDE